MTLKKFYRQFRYYRNNYDFQLSGRTYRELEELANHEGELLPD